MAHIIPNTPEHVLVSMLVTELDLVKECIDAHHKALNTIHENDAATEYGYADDDELLGELCQIEELAQALGIPGYEFS